MNGYYPRKPFRNLASVLLAAFSFVACASGSGRAPGSVETVTLQVGDRTREYIVFEPKTLQDNADKRALVIVLHGGGGTAKQIARGKSRPS